ncbi:unnamed protein product [Scytosiphon promiscuus]
MRCVGWLPFIVLVSSRRAACLVVRSLSFQERRCGGRPVNCCNQVQLTNSPDPCRSTRDRCLQRSTHPPASRTAASPRARGRQAFHCCRGSGSNPELDPAASAAAMADASGPADATTTVDQDVTLLSVLELALDFLGGSTQWVVASAVGFALVTRADVGTLVYVIGSLLNAVFSKVLKKTINQVRPDGARLSDPGMPSSHAMSLFYLGTYLVLGLQNHGALMVDPSLPRWPLGVTETQSLLGLYAVTASLWRVKAGFHTLPQVCVGAVVGTADAFLWYRFCQAFLLSQAEVFFGGPDVPVGLAVGLCGITFFTFGNAQRKIAKILAIGRKDD